LWFLESDTWRCVVKTRNIVSNWSVFRRFKYFADLTGIPLDRVETLDAFSNPTLVEYFEATRKYFAHQRKFSSSGENLRGDDHRRRFLDIFDQKWKKFPEMQEFVKETIFPAFSGGSMESSSRISASGFGLLKVTDEGYYGKGVYFTTSVSYALRFSRRTPNGTVPLILALVLPGKPFPVIEAPYGPDHKPSPNSFLGQPCKTGYDSHYTIVEPGIGFPAKTLSNPDHLADELVIFNVGQTLPLFMVELRL